MQAAVEYNVAKRSRYYQSVIDIDSLSKDEPVIDEFFNYLKNSTNEQAAKSSSKLVKLLNDKVNNVRLNTSLEVKYLKFEQLQREQYERGRQIGIEEGIE